MYPSPSRGIHRGSEDDKPKCVWSSRGCDLVDRVWQSGAPRTLKRAIESVIIVAKSTIRVLLDLPRYLDQVLDTVEELGMLGKQPE